MSSARPRRIVDGPADARWTVVLAHGASIPMDHPSLTTIAQGLAERAICVVRFEFPYMRRRFTDGTEGPPNRLPRLQAAFRDAVAAAPVTGRLAVAGKSMGARVAGTVVEDVRADALVAFGYPFHAKDDPSELRFDPLNDADCPALVIQNPADPLGTREEVEGYTLGEHVEISWLDGEEDDARLKAIIEQTAGFLERVG